MIYTADTKRKYDDGNREGHRIMLGVVDCRQYTFESGQVYRTGLTENHTLILTVSGSVCFGGRTVGSGHFLYLSRFSGFTLEIPRGACILQITFEYSEPIPLFRERVRVLKAPLKTREYANELYFNTFLQESLPGVNDGLLLNILSTLNILCSSGCGELSLYQKCCEWLEQQAGVYVTAEDAAAAMNCTVAHLNRVVKKNSGKCLSEMVGERQLRKIKQFLDDPAYSTKDIARRMGFGSPELLRKYVKYHTGLSLKEYRATAEK